DTCVKLIFLSSGVNDNEPEHQRSYHFGLVTDMTRSGHQQVPGNGTLDTSTSTAACGVQLRVGATYLIGGLYRPAGSKWSLFACNSYVEDWTELDTRGRETKIGEYRARCSRFDLEQNKS